MLKPRYWLAWTLAFITQKQRYFPVIEWSKESWTHNVFRTWELIFGRRFGIRAESSVAINQSESGKIEFKREFFTLEATIAHAETLIRGQFSKVRNNIEYNCNTAVIALFGHEFKFVPAQGYWQDLGYRFAIASDAQGAVSIVNPNSVCTIPAFTVSGSDRLLYYGWVHNGGTPTDITQNGASATAQIDSGTIVDGLTLRHYYLKGPSTGSNTVVFTMGSSVLQLCGANSYTGVDQTTPLNASVVNGSTSETVTTSTLTTTVDNCWHMATYRNGSSGDSTAGASTTLRSTTAGYIQMYDGNAAITPAGSNTLTINATGGAANCAAMGAAFAPSGGGGGSATPTQMLMGMGT